MWPRADHFLSLKGFRAVGGKQSKETKDQVLDKPSIYHLTFIGVTAARKSLEFPKATEGNFCKASKYVGNYTRSLGKIWLCSRTQTNPQS